METTIIDEYENEDNNKDDDESYVINLSLIDGSTWSICSIFELDDIDVIIGMFLECCPYSTKIEFIDKKTNEIYSDTTEMYSKSGDYTVVVSEVPLNDKQSIGKKNPEYTKYAFDFTEMIKET